MCVGKTKRFVNRGALGSKGYRKCLALCRKSSEARSCAKVASAFNSFFGVCHKLKESKLEDVVIYEGSEFR